MEYQSLFHLHLLRDILVWHCIFIEVESTILHTHKCQRTDGNALGMNLQAFVQMKVILMSVL